MPKRLGPRGGPPASVGLHELHYRAVDPFGLEIPTAIGWGVKKEDRMASIEWIRSFDQEKHIIATDEGDQHVVLMGEGYSADYIHLCLTGYANKIQFSYGF
jgi:hypothetical protein